MEEKQFKEHWENYYIDFYAKFGLKSETVLKLAGYTFAKYKDKCKIEDGIAMAVYQLREELIEMNKPWWKKIFRK
mgnify:CR=1 FL=1